VHTLAQRQRGQIVPHLRRGAERHRIDRRVAPQQLLKAAEVGHALKRRVARADRGGQFEGVIARDGRQMLVAGDLAEAHDSDTDRVHLQRLDGYGDGIRAR
jgi:hypothetical protein